MEDNEPRDADEGDELEATIMRADHAFGAESVGTTVDEELAGESLDQRLAERSGRTDRGPTPPSRWSTRVSWRTRRKISSRTR